MPDWPSGGGSGSFPSIPGGGSMPSGSGGYAGNVPETEEISVPSSYTLDESGIYSIVPHDTVSVEISVDELDIRSLAVGQDVTVSLDALPGQSFEGRIVSIGSDGTYDSGNTKYPVTVSLSRTEQMYSGMNAGISVLVSETENCLTVPAAALVEQGGRTYVYTSYLDEEDELGGLTEIRTGLSDGNDVQVLSGLSEGDTVYYRYADSLVYTFVLPGR